MSRALFIFRRDLRLPDNTALNAALHECDEVVAAFFADPRQVEDHPYKSNHALQFMGESLLEVAEHIEARGGRLYCKKIEAAKGVEELINKADITAVYLNRDYTPFSRKRDETIAQVCDDHDIPYNEYGDYLLNEPEAVHKDNGDPYTVYTPFMKKSRQVPVRSPDTSAKRHFFAGPIEGYTSDVSAVLSWQKNEQLKVRGGREHALRILRTLHEFADYEHQRNLVAEDATTHLSAYHKFGTVSVREVYEAIAQQLSPEHGLINELYWRDFFTHIAWHFPRVFGHAFHLKYDKLDWSKSEQDFQAWCEGKTGFPIVDAGMRELNTTGYMHNRVRMIVASFLVKDLHIDWRWGEKYFAQQLVDYDPAVNNGNWQWAASTGCDAQPYFRIFNPWLQQERYDPECLYIKRWVEELQDVEPKVIHKWLKQEGDSLFDHYPAPIVDHKIESALAKECYKAIA